MSEDKSAGARDLDSLIATDVPDKLHIGGMERVAGWQVLNVQPGEHVDFVADLRDLSRFADNSFDVVYGSHVLEHFSYFAELPGVLASLDRIIRPGGRLLASVPDLDVLCRLFVDESLTPGERFHVMRMMFGGQSDPYDFHYAGLNMGIFGQFLATAGFREIYRIPSFDIFDDSSTIMIKDWLVSLNVVAIK